MKTYLLAVRDICADVYGQPFSAAQLGGAIRDFGDQINSGDNNNMFARHPEHYELWLIAEYHDDSGQIDTDPPGGRKQLAAGINLIIKKS